LIVHFVERQSMKLLIGAVLVLVIGAIPTNRSGINTNDNAEPPKNVVKTEAVKTTPPATKPVRTADKPSNTQSATVYPVGCEHYRPMLQKYDWNVDTMLRIMQAESGCNPTNHNINDNHGSCLGSYGLLQIGCVHGYDPKYLEDPKNNIAVAYKVYKSSGYNAWTTY